MYDSSFRTWFMDRALNTLPLRYNGPLMANDELVVAWFGRMGQGKTINMMKWALKGAEDTGRKVYAKFKINHPSYVHFDDYRELEQVRGAIILFDEIHTFFDSRRYNNLEQQKFTHWFTQTRKMCNTVFYTSQSADQVEKRVVTNTMYVIWCTKNNLRNELYEDFYDSQMGINRLVFMKRRVFRAPHLLYSFYDTRELIKANFNE